MRVRGVAAGLSLVPVIGTLLVGLLILVLVSLPFENSEPPTSDETLWLTVFVTGVAVAFVLAVVQVVSLATGHVRSGFVAFALHAAFATVLLWLALEESRSDAALLTYFAAVELCGLFAVVIAARGHVGERSG